ncbi:MAG: HD domain-containing protein [Desulforhopalus sp.]
MKQMNFVFTGHSLLNICLAGSVIILVGVTFVILLLGKKQPPPTTEISLEELAKHWIKDKSGEIHIAELAPLWRDDKQSPTRCDYSFQHERVVDFTIKQIEQASWFRNAPLQKEVCYQLLQLLDKEGGCPSVVNVADDVEASWDSNTYTLLGKTSLLDHTINVAGETINLLFEADGRHVIPDALIAALGHDLGKLPSVKGHLYSIGEHPLAAGRVLAGITTFKQLAKKEEISRAIKLHHKRPEGLLGKTLKKADQLARQKELELALEQVAEQEENPSLARPSVMSHGAKSAWQAEVDIYGEDSLPAKQKTTAPNLIDISKWFDAQALLDNLKPYINRVTGRRFMAFSMPDGYLYFQAKAIEEVARQQAEQAGAMDIATMAANDPTMREVLFTVVHHLRVDHDVIARGLIKDEFFGGYFTITMKSGKALKGFYTPFHTEAFTDKEHTAGFIAEMENDKPALLKNFMSVKPYLNDANL